ncbi:PREDICTED: BRISC complex subunit Abro1-like isoform X1 [Lupinus angustifolius]|uniref:BRISC complex subunit Abro1-like isoform X1 n=1 Tax=Lupinus angustifolius TaxID=3871 RepID=UPI00092EF102|nr:PREDICTED: BRISC complex subunit Abro1-like isoform X1 [Lupinus angustifolius]XP_019446383.1 PREDICTED: BRISC complex subunit Abro1-like isoform X1 [Lupinus angustifolius]XP_019446393.1 PREDICTED: BRISC complex subunit Abro1-like isoform X1 [Lupinus angustifolius]XP_019446400.1 PREDICTED: BRISC complex subunit Abro1-like isoform X1 [Lupinus angustifolius]XP_019446409.1 PREDICTED: BRISC complex subunit Abro1-like isoform X1 [Lupinus angustifolius]
MDDSPLQKIAISGPTLASLIQRFSTSPSSIDGLLFGHVTQLTPLNLSDDSADSADSPTLLATVTGFLSSPSSFFDSSGIVNPSSLRRLLHHHNCSLLGWFSARRKTPLRPSMREFSVTASLSSLSQFSSSIKNATKPSNFDPCVFLLFASPSVDHNTHIHTHEYRAYQFRGTGNSFEAKSIQVINIGPAFRGHYGSFSPNSMFPALDCEVGGSPMKEDEERLSRMKQVAKDKKELDDYAEGFEIGKLSKLMGSEATSYTAGLEDLYEKMLVKIQNLTRDVENSSVKVLELESYNKKLKLKILRSAASE